MHNRRFGAFVMGAWLLGTILVWFATSQSLLTVDRVLSVPPPQVQKEFDDIGPEVARQILRYEANQLNRRITETWEVLQLGLAGALLASSFLTTSRSKVAIACAALMMVLSAVMAFYLSPAMSALGRAFDFLPPTAALREREAFQRLDVWHRVLIVLNTLLAIVVTTRLLFDFYEFGAKLIPDLNKGAGKRRRRRTPLPGTAPGAAGSMHSRASDGATQGTHNEASQNS